MLSDKIGFEYELFEVEDGKWGAYNPKTKSWNGLVKAVMDHKADMVVTSLKITPERNSAIEFSVPFLETGITIIVAVRDGVISPTAFLEPYDYPSWCLILVFSVHASGAAIFIFEWLSPNGLDRGKKPIREHRFSLFRSFWLIWAMLFGAAVNVDSPRGMSSRCMANIWALFAVVFTASYTANLAAFMITKEDYDHLSGIHDWRLVNPYAHKPPFKFATIPDGSTETYLINNKPEMHAYMKPFNKSTVAKGVKALKDGEINAFIYDATVLDYLSAHDDGCKLRTVGTWHAMTGYGIGVPKGSKWLTYINKYMTKFQHEGEMERLQRFWFAGACSQKKEEGESSMPLGILNFTSAFILLAGGMLLGGLLLLLEHTYFKFLRAKLRKWDKCGCCGLVSLSMGKSLTFEQSVREAIEMTRAFKCNNPICETQMWKTKHELDMALLRIDKLKNQLLKLGVTPDKGIGIRNRKGNNRQNRPVGQPPPIGWKYTPDKPPASIGWKDELTSESPGRPPYPVDSSTEPVCTVENHNSVSPQKSANARPGSKSLPASPMKKKGGQVVTGQERGQYVPPRPPLGITRSKSVPDHKQQREPKPSQDRKPSSDQKTKYRDGHYYMAVAGEDTKVEKETVL